MLYCAFGIKAQREGMNSKLYKQYLLIYEHHTVPISRTAQAGEFTATCHSSTNCHIACMPELIKMQ